MYTVSIKGPGLDLRIDSDTAAAAAVEAVPDNKTYFHFQHDAKSGLAKRFAASTGGDIQLDRSTGLMWTTATLGDAVAWARAKGVAGECRAGGYDDWRLPTVAELLALVDYGRHDPAIDADAFPGTRAARYWTSSVDASDPGSYAWCVHFDYGGSYLGAQCYAGFVRAVRSVAAPAASQ